MLDPDVAADFLVNRTGDPDRQAAGDLADELGGLPLALEQAAAYIQAIGDTLAGYLALFRQRRAELLARGEPTGYDKTVASTWALAFDRLQQTEPGAVGLLRLLAFCAPEAIPLRLLLQPRPGLAGRLGEEVAPVLVPLLEDPLAASDAIAALRRYSLVTPAADGSVSVHRLVQAVTADQMPAELAGAVAAGRRRPDRGRDPRRHRPAGDLAGMRGAAAARPGGPGPDSDGMARIASYLGSSGSYAAARDLSSESRLTLREQDASARSTRTPWPPATSSPAGPGRRGTRPRPGTSSPRCCPCSSGSSARSTRTPWPPAPTSPAGPGRRGIAAAARDHVRRAAARARAGPRPGAPGHPGRPRTTSPAGPGGGGRGRRPGPVRRAAARARAGPRPGAPGTP